MEVIPVRKDRTKSSPASALPPRPFLRWAGSKLKVLCRLRLFWKSHHTRYVEPFAGSACLFFDLLPSRAILGDNNSALIETYRVVRENPGHLYQRLTHIPRDAPTYYRWRSIDPKTLDRETRALRFVYLNRNCFNGIYRTNMRGAFNVPYGGKKGLPSGQLEKTDFMRCAEQLKRARLVSGDYLVTLQHVQNGDFVYLDPPYALNSRRIFREYSAKPFETQDVPAFSKQLRQLDRKGAEFLVSYADCKEARELASQWNAARLLVRRNVAGFVGDRRNACEWLISNMAIPTSKLESELV